MSRLTSRLLQRLRELDSGMPAAERQRILERLMPDFLPGEWHIDPGSYYARWKS